MTKKELTALLIAFLGGWLLVQMICSFFPPILTLTAKIFLPGRAGGGSDLLWATGVGLVPVAVYGAFAVLLIRRSSAFAEILLRYAKIQPDERIEGIGLAGLGPMLFSMLGLYFIVVYLPSLLNTLVKWFILEARVGNLVEATESAEKLRAYRSSIVYESAVLAMAFSLFRRPDFWADLVRAGPKRPV